VNQYEPPIYVASPVPLTFDADEAQRRRETYEARRREYTRLWREHEQHADASRSPST
jgi:hypothetical protein